MDLPTTASEALQNHHGTLNHGTMPEREGKQLISTTSTKPQNTTRKGGEPKEQPKSAKTSHSTTHNGSIGSCIGRPDCLYGGGTPEVKRLDTVTTLFKYNVDGRSCECNLGVITTCPPTPARPPNNNMLALVVEEDTRAIKRVKMKYGPSNHINHHCDRRAQRDAEMGARCSDGNDSPSRWLKNGAIFKPIQAILTYERQNCGMKRGE